MGEISLELRWFFNGVMPAEVQYWFANQLPGNYASKEKSRTDIYFLIGDREDLGLKISRGLLEFKWRRDAEPFSLSEPPISGVKETWIKEKWGYAKEYTNNVDMAFGKANLKGLRVQVQKIRAIRKYKVEDSGAVMDLATGETAVRLLKVELTGLTQHDRPWWTFSIEISGEPQNLHEIFPAAVKIVLDGHPKLDALDAGHSCGYPQWLAHSN